MSAYLRGYAAYKNGVPLDANPYPFVDEEGSDHQMWVSGWYDAQDDAA